MQAPSDTRLSALQKGLLAATALRQQGRGNDLKSLGKDFDRVKTMKQAIEYLRRRH